MICLWQCRSIVDTYSDMLVQALLVLATPQEVCQVGGFNLCFLSSHVSDLYSTHVLLNVTFHIYFLS